jgi:hypothetical protein
MLGRERPVQANDGDADALTRRAHRVDRLAGRAEGRADQHDHPVGVGRAVVVDEVVSAAAALGQAVHRRLHGGRHGGVERAARLARLEEHVGVLRSATHDGTVGVEAAQPQRGDALVGHHRPHVVLAQQLDVVELVAGAEAVEEVQERH